MEIKKVENQELDKIVTESGLQLSESEQIKQSYLPYFEQLATIKEESLKINFENPTALDEKIARDLRLRTVKIRTGSATVKDERKRIHSLKANIEQSAWNLIKSTCELDEETFLQVEKKREIAEKKRIELLRDERLELLKDLTDTTPYISVIGTLSEDSFNELLSGFKSAKEAREKEAREKELARIKAEQEAQVERERIEKENKRLKEEQEKQNAAIEKEREETRKKEAAIAEQRRIEQEKADKLLETQRKENEKKLAKQKAEADAKLKVEREAKEKVEAELKEKQRIEKEAKDKADREERERIAVQKKAAKAPDKDKLNVGVNSLTWPEIRFVTDDGERVHNEIRAKFEGFKTWALTQIEQL